MADGFLGRWSRRKLDVRDGKPLSPEPPRAAPEPVAPAAGALASASTIAPAAPEPVASPAPPPAPTLDDVRALTRESDYSAFTRPGVDPQVSNAAMKKLFSDPHYNVMDGLDTYIDDYSKPDPIPPAMLRQLASARFLNLFADEEKEAEAAAAAAGARPGAEADKAEVGSTDSAALPREVADDPAAQSVAQSGSAGDAGSLDDRVFPDHADPDLRLQQDDAPAGEAARGRAS